MRTTTSVIPVIAIVALCSASSWAAADEQRERNNRGRDQAAARTVAPDRSSSQRPSRDTQTSSTPPRRSEPTVATPRGPGSRTSDSNRSANSGYPSSPARGTRDAAPPRDVNPNRNSSTNRNAYSNGGSYRYSVPSRRNDSYARGDSYGHGGYGGSYSYRDSYWYRGEYSHRAYYRPMPYYGYSWRPYLDLGFGIFVGYPMAFPAESYYYSRSLTYASYGGQSFEVAPADAYVFVDGNYVGTARDFGPFTQPLTLSVGMHRIALDAPGYRGVEFGVDVQPGQLIPYRGQLEYLGPR